MLIKALHDILALWTLKCSLTRYKMRRSYFDVLKIFSIWILQVRL